jgi:hypothetical protein
MTKHPFRTAIENSYGKAEFSKLFSPDVVLLAPMLTRPVTGTDQVLNVIDNAANIAGPIRYTTEIADNRQTFLLWTGQVGGFALEAATILVDGDDGLIHQIRVLMRSWPVVTLFRDAMYQALSGTIPDDYWELGPKRTEPAAHRKFTPIALKSIEMAPDMVLHSPMLAKSVAGRRLVEQAVSLAHEIQSPSSYTSIIATPELLIEVFDCDADGYPMEGMWVQKLNAEGQINDLTVMLRPYPAVTVLRNMTKELAEKRGLLGDEYWNLPRSP